MTKPSLIFAALLLAFSCHAQTSPLGARYEGIALANMGAGSLQVVSSPTIKVCTFGSNVSNCAQNPVTTYTDNTLGTACPPSAPVILAGSNTCSATGDAQGNFGFWVAPQQTYSYSIAGNGVATKIYSFTSGGQGGSGGGSAVTQISVSPGSVGFGQVTTNTTASSQPIFVTNTGNVPVVISNPTITGAAFSSPNPSACSGTLAPQNSCQLQVTVTPTSLGPLSGTIFINSTAPVNSVNPPVVQLTATGTAASTFPLTVQLAGTGAGTVFSDEFPPLISCGVIPPNAPTGTCSNNYAAGSTPTLTATPLNGSSLASLTGAGCAGSPCPVTVSAATVVTATFNPPTPNFTVNITGQGQGTGSVISNLPGAGGILNCTSTAGVVSSGGNSGCSGSFPQGTVLTLIEGPGANSTFAGWSGPCTGTSTSCVITIGSNVTVSLNYAPTAAPLSLIQNVSGCSTASSSIACTWGSPQIAGDLLMCVGAWPDASTTVSSISDTKGNTYTQFPTISPKVGTGITQVGYYAQNILAATAGSNTTTMNLSAAVGQISGTNLTTGGTTTPATSFTTASITPTANRLVLLSVTAHLGSGNGPGSVSSVSGNGLTWIFVTGLSYGPATGTGQTNRIEVWRAMGSSPSAGVVTINYGASPSVESWTISQFTGMDTSGTNGSGAIGITATQGKDTATASPLTVTMGAFGSATSGTYGTGSTDGASTMSAGTSMTLLGTSSSNNSNTDEFATGNVSPVTLNYSGGTLRSGMIGIEIKVPSNRRDMRCLEYSGVKTTGSPIDQSIAATGSSALPVTGTITTTAAADLMTGFTASLSGVSAADTSHNWVQRVKNAFGDDEEDQQGVNIGTYNFQPTLSSSANWVAFNIGWLNNGGAAAGNFSLTLTGQGSGAGGVTGNAGTPSINCNVSSGVVTGPCSSSVSLGSSVTLTANPVSGSAFLNWTGIQGCSTSPVCIVPNITANASVTANFTLSGVQNYYIASSTSTPAGNDANSGLDASHPWLTFTHAQAVMVQGAGGTVVHLGACPSTFCYTGTIQLGLSGISASRRITWQSDTPFAAKLDGVINAYGDFVTVKNLEIKDTSTASDGITTLFNGNPKIFGSFGWFLNNYIHDVQFASSEGCLGGNSGILISPGSHDYIVDSNIVLRAGNWGGCTTTQGTSAHGLYISGYHGSVTNNQVSNVAGYGIELYHNACENVIANNTVYHNFTGGIQLAGPADGLQPCALTLGSDDYNTVTNNLVVHNAFGTILPNTGHANFAVIFGTSGTGAHNKAFNNFMAGNLTNGGGQLNSITVSSGLPAVQQVGNFGQTSITGIFVNYQDDGSGDYHLTGGSPAANAGVPSSSTVCATVPGIDSNCVPTLDFAGSSRGSTPSIGAYQ